MHTGHRHHRPLAMLAAAFVAATLLVATPAQAGPAGAWQRISPPSQAGGAIAFDADRQRLCVFGGDGTSFVHVAASNGPPTEWSDLRTTGTPPVARSGAALLYDPAGDRLLVFGGQDIAGRFYNDVWQLTLSGTPAWSRVATGGTVPDPRANFGACFDPSRRLLVVFGGLDSTGSLLTNDIYQVDLGQPSPAWTRWYPDGNTPSPRSGATLCDDPFIDGMLVFGGNDGGADQSDAYTMSFGSHAWTSIAASGDVPPPAANALATFDTDDTLLVVWGGSGGDDDVRTLAPASGVWTLRPNTGWQAGPAGHTHPLGAWITGAHQFEVLDGDGSNELFDFFLTPPATSYWQNWQDPGLPGDLRSGCTFVIDRADTSALLFGGDDENGSPLNSWWNYSLGTPHGWSEGFFTWLSGTIPPPVWGQASVWDDKRDRMLTFGGQLAGYVRTNAVSELDVVGWFSPGVPAYNWGSPGPTGTAPAARYDAAAIYDPAGDRMLVFGGNDVTGWGRGDLWQLALAGTPAWSALPRTGGPSGRYGHSAVYDAPKRRMIVFGGTDSLYGGLDNDVWALNLPAATWTHLTPSGTAPPARQQHTAVFDSRRERMLVFGGQVASGDARDVWELSLAPATPVWTRLAPSTATYGLPIGRYQHAAVYDSTGDRMLVFGGLVPPISIFGNPWATRDFWSLQFDFSGGLAAVDAAAPAAEFAAGEPAPNPARGSSRLAFALPGPGHVRAAIFDVAGRRVSVLADGVMPAGRHELSWSGRDAAGNAAVSGLYFYRLEASGRTVTRKVMLVR